MVYFDQAWWWTGSNLASAPCRFTLSPPYTGIIITCSVEIIFPGCRIIHKHAVNVHGTQNILYLFVLAMALHSLSRLWVSWMDVCSLPVTVKNGARKTCLQGKASGDAYQNFAPQTVQHLPTRFSYLSIIFVHMPLQIEMTRPPHIRQTFVRMMATTRNCSRMAMHCISFSGSPPPVSDNAIQIGHEQTILQ